METICDYYCANWNYRFDFRDMPWSHIHNQFLARRKILHKTKMALSKKLQICQAILYYLTLCIKEYFRRIFFATLSCLTHLLGLVYTLGQNVIFCPKIQFLLFSNFHFTKKSLNFRAKNHLIFSWKHTFEFSRQNQILVWNSNISEFFENY